MAMGTRKTQQQASLFVSHDELPRSQAHPFYKKLNQLLDAHGFDDYVNERCQKFYAEVMGRPGMPPGIYFRTMMIGYFEGIDSERGIAWRSADSLSLRSFLGYALNESVATHCTISRTRRLIDIETHEEVFSWVLEMLAKAKLVSGKTVGIDASTLEANAALRSIVHRATNEEYEDFLIRLARESGIETPTREDLAKLDRKRKNKGSNKEWRHPHDSDARIAKMKDGRTHLAHKVEHAVDLDTGVILAVTLQEADQGDTTTGPETLETSIEEVKKLAENEDPEVRNNLKTNRVEESVFDKGYHSNEMLMYLEEMQVRAYVSEPNRGKRNWKGKEAERKAVYANRRRIKGKRGKQLMRSRGELVERPFAHLFETGGMRRTHLRHHENIRKRLLIHTAGFNLGQLMRSLTKAGSPRSLQNDKNVKLAHAWLYIRLMMVFQTTRSSLKLVQEKLGYLRGVPEIDFFPPIENRTLNTGC